MKKFKIKLKHNFWELNNLEKIIYLVFIRPFSDKKDRLFFDGNFMLPGQMYKAERKALYDAVVNSKPDLCFEIGTYTGGGSTFFISEALKDLKHGKLITTESDEFLWNKAKERYGKYIKNNFKFVEFLHTESTSVFIPHLEKKDYRHFILLDGAEDSKQTLEQYLFFKPFFKDGTILALHDWNTEKSASVKPVILSEPKWQKIKELQQPESIGLAIFEYHEK